MASGRTKMANIRKVGVIGAGQMGGGIAHVAALAGFDVRLNDAKPEVVKSAIATPPTTRAEEPESETIDDASINAQVKVALLLHHSTSSINTEVGTTNGVVTVSGLAKNAAEKTLVTKLATDISGVKSVINNMTISPALSGRSAKLSPVVGLRFVTAGE